jgi:superfamily II DNA or RNA helicase
MTNNEHREIEEFVDSLHERWSGYADSNPAIFTNLAEANEAEMGLDLIDSSASALEEARGPALPPELAVLGVYAGVFAFAIGNAVWQGFKKTDTYALIQRYKESIMGSIFARVKWKPEKRIIDIKGIRYDLLLKRVDELYKEKGFGKIFGRSHKFFRQLAYDAKIRKKLLVEDINGLCFHHFFALEASKIFEELAFRYGFSYYEKISSQLWTKTWLKEFMEEPTGNKLSLDPLNAIRFDFKGYQRDFIAEYPLLKRKLSLRGTVLSFDQGLGKTLTATGLAECLGKQRVYIVCPNTLRDVWLQELRKYYAKYDDPLVAKREIYVHGSPGQEYAGKDCRFVIVNNEAITKIYDTVKDVPGSDSMLILDEGHNFRNFKGSRTAELIALREKIGCDDVLPMSGTPIKATPNEIVPVLLLIDKVFDMDAAKTYNALFDIDDVSTKNVVQERFGKIIYRKRKADVLDLPKKNELTLSLHVDNNDQYLLENITPVVNQRFLEIYAEKMNSLGEQRAKYVEYVIRYSTSGILERDKYLMWVKNYGSQGRSAGAEGNWHDITVHQMEEYADRYVIPNVPREQLNDFRNIHAQVLLTRRSAMGEAIGEIMPKMRTQMYLDLWKANKGEIIKRIRECPQKTVIFSIFLPVVRQIHADLNEAGVGAVLVTGDVKNERTAVIDKFKNDDDVEVMVATSQTLSVGVTLVEATQMFFFGTPWRSADYNQAADRIHRIGQKFDVTIYNVILGTTKPNLSTRMQDILRWSERMFGTMIDNEDGGGHLFNNEAVQLPENLETLGELGLLEHGEFNYE